MGWEGKCDVQDCLWLHLAPPLPAHPAPCSPCSGSLPSLPSQTYSPKGEGPPCTALSTRSVQLTVAAVTLSPFQGQQQGHLLSPSRPEAGRHWCAQQSQRAVEECTICSLIHSFTHSAVVPWGPTAIRDPPWVPGFHSEPGTGLPALMSSRPVGGTRPSSVRLQLRPGPR